MTTVPTGKYSDRILLTVHGVMSDNSRLVLLRNKCAAALPGLICESYYYGSVIPFHDLTEDTAQLIFQAVRDKLELLYLKYLNGQNRRLFVVAHSFGTLAVIRALEMHIAGLSLDSLILLGSIVPRKHFWDGLVSSGQLAREPVAAVRPLDSVVRLGRLVGGGDSGARGFIANGRHRALESYKNGGHSSYVPGDVDDIISIVRGAPLIPEHGTFESWFAKAGHLRRLRYRLQNLLLWRT